MINHKNKIYNKISKDSVLNLLRAKITGQRVNKNFLSGIIAIKKVNKNTNTA